MAGKGKTESILQSVGHELKTKPPEILGKTRRKFGAARAESQRKAILLNKARKAGARVPAMRKH